MTNPAPLANQAIPLIVIEDLPMIRQVLSELLEESGHYRIVAFCETEEEALVQFDALRPEAVIVDLKLKSGTGLGFLQRRRIEQGYDPLLIVLTNHPLPALEAACRKAGAHHFLDKSRDLPRLRETLDQWRSAS